MAVGAFVSLGAWLAMSLWSKFVIALLAAMCLARYHEADAATVHQSVQRISTRMPRRVSLGAGAMGRLAMEGVRTAMNMETSLFSPATSRAVKKTE